MQTVTKLCDHNILCSIKINQANGLALYFSRIWNSRRIVYTKKIIAFANLHDEDVLDVIPMSEILIIREMSVINEIADGSSEFNADTENEDVDNDGEIEGTETKNVLQIETTPEGYNSGRPYQIQTKNSQDFRAIFEDLTKLSAIARDEAEKKSKFKKLQVRVGKVFNSNPMQQFLAIMIFGVRFRCALTTYPSMI